MASVTANTEQAKLLYILKSPQGIYWLASIATNATDAWAHGEQFDSREKLKADGYKCVRVRLEEIQWR